MSVERELPAEGPATLGTLVIGQLLMDLVEVAAKGSLIIYGLGGAAGRGNRHNSRELPYFCLIFSEHTI